MRRLLTLLDDFRVRVALNVGAILFSLYALWLNLQC